MLEVLGNKLAHTYHYYMYPEDVGALHPDAQTGAAVYEQPSNERSSGNSQSSSSAQIPGPPPVDLSLDVGRLHGGKFYADVKMPLKEVVNMEKRFRRDAAKTFRFEVSGAVWSDGSQSTGKCCERRFGRPKPTAIVVFRQSPCCVRPRKSTLRALPLLRIFAYPSPLRSAPLPG